MPSAATIHGHELAAASVPPDPERRRAAPMSVKDWVQLLVLAGALAAQWSAINSRLAVIEARLTIIYDHVQLK